MRQCNSRTQKCTTQGLRSTNRSWRCSKNATAVTISPCNTSRPWTYSSRTTFATCRTRLTSTGCWKTGWYSCGSPHVSAKWPWSTRSRGWCTFSSPTRPRLESKAPRSKAGTCRAGFMTKKYVILTVCLAWTWTFCRLKRWCTKMWLVRRISISRLRRRWTRTACPRPSSGWRVCRSSWARCTQWSTLRTSRTSTTIKMQMSQVTAYRQWFLIRIIPNLQYWVRHRPMRYLFTRLKIWSWKQFWSWSRTSSLWPGTPWMTSVCLPRATRGCRSTAVMKRVCATCLSSRHRFTHTASAGMTMAIVW